MAKINVQFHGLPLEIFEFAKECAIEYKLVTVAMQFCPNFNAKLIDDYSSIEEYEKIDRLCLCNVQPDILAVNAIEFMKKNPDCLSVTLGKYDNEVLVESVLAAQTENKAALKLWRKIVKKLNSVTSEGAWIVNSQTGAKSFNKKHRYTDAAKKISEDGVKIKPIAGWNHFILGSNL